MKDLLTRALDAHGGLSRWREIEAFQLAVWREVPGSRLRYKHFALGARPTTRF
jgi:hypothetical protein